MAADNGSYRSNATEHIRALSTLSTRLPPILNSAATTLSQLTNAPIVSSTAPAVADDEEPKARREAIATSAQEYFTAVFNLSKELHKQVNDLEEAGVIPAEEVRYIARTEEPAARQPPLPGMPPEPPAIAKDTEATVTNGGLGEFDIGVLNARAGVRGTGEDELLDRVKRLLGDLHRRTEDSQANDKMEDV